VGIKASHDTIPLVTIDIPIGCGSYGKSVNATPLLSEEFQVVNLVLVFTYICSMSTQLKANMTLSSYRWVRL
jgi:hypothetical protein